MIPSNSKPVTSRPNSKTVTPTAAARADLHCHSTASQVSKLGIQRSAGLPECATPPEEVYALAKRRGMDFVTITDHDTIDGVLEIADRPDVFISEELTAWFAGEPQAVHILCYGITPDDHEWLQANNGDVERCAEYLREHALATALAHPFYAVEAPLGPRHRSRLAQLFGVWETRNGSRARELNMPAAVYIETHGGTGIAGSDDHAGVDIGRTFTQTPAASTPEEFFAHIRTGDVEALGDQGSAAKWTHAAIALATRALEPTAEPVVAEAQSSRSDSHLTSRSDSQLSPAAVLRLAESVVSQGHERTGEETQAAFTSADARALLNGWLDSVGLPAGRELIELMQEDGFSHSDLFRRARATHETRLKGVVGVALEAAGGNGEIGAVLGAVFEACLPAIPYVPAIAFLAGEKSRLVGRDDSPRRVALVADGVGSMHGVSHTIERLRELGVPGYEVEVIGTDSGVDRRLPAVAEVDVPFYEGLGVGVPGLPSLVEILAEGRYDLIHVASPGPAGIAAALVARIAGLPLICSHHTDLVAYAALRSGRPEIEAAMRITLSLLYGQSELVLSPSSSSDASLAGLGLPAERIGRWSRGVDTSRFDPGLRSRSRAAVGSHRRGEIQVLYAGRQTKEKGVELLADSFLRAAKRDPRLQLVLAGGGPEEGWLSERLGDRATSLGWLYGDDLAVAYASSDLFLFCSETDTYGQVIVEAQASGLPVIAVAAGGPLDLIVDGETGLLCPPDAAVIADALVGLAQRPMSRRALSRRGVQAAQSRTWAAAMAELAAGYDRVLDQPLDLVIEPIAAAQAA